MSIVNKVDTFALKSVVSIPTFYRTREWQKKGAQTKFGQIVLAETILNLFKKRGSNAYGLFAI